MTLRKYCSGVIPAAAASSFAHLMARPSCSDRVTMPCTPKSFSVRSSMQNSAMVSVPPHVMVAARAMSSVHLFVTVDRMPALPFSSM